MDKFFAKFIPRKSLKKIENVDFHNVVLVHDDVRNSSNKYLPKDSIEYVNIVDDDGEEFLVSEHIDENDNLNESSDTLHDKSDKIDKVVDEDERIDITYLNQSFPNLQVA